MLRFYDLNFGPSQVKKPFAGGGGANIFNNKTKDNGNCSMATAFYLFLFSFHLMTTELVTTGTKSRFNGGKFDILLRFSDLIPQPVAITGIKISGGSPDFARIIFMHIDLQRDF